MIKLSVDLMGSDLGPVELSKGLLDFLKDYPDCEVKAFGDPKILSPIFKEEKRVTIMESLQVVPMEVSPVQFLRYKKSSMYLAIQEAKKDDSIDGVVTSGSTGGFVVGCTLILKNIANVLRAGLTAPFITQVRGKQTVILDIGASNVNTADELVCFAKMGSIYARKVLNEQNPSVYLLSNGAEEGKGLKESVDAYEKLKDYPWFKGNCEARDVLDGTRDVVVTSGYPGNILLKSIEGTASMMNSLIKKAFKKNLFTKIGYLFAKSGFKDMKKTLDYRATGGAILLGVNKVAVKAHGNSNAYGFYNALRVAYSMSKGKIVESIKEEMKNER